MSGKRHVGTLVNCGWKKLTISVEPLPEFYDVRVGEEVEVYVDDACEQSHFDICHYSFHRVVISYGDEDLELRQDGQVLEPYSN